VIDDEINADESNRVEFKEKLPKDSKKYVKTTVAYSNSRGGKLIFGVSDDCKIVGIGGDPFSVRDIIMGEISNL